MHNVAYHQKVQGQYIQQNYQSLDTGNHLPQSSKLHTYATFDDFAGHPDHQMVHQYR